MWQIVILIVLTILVLALVGLFAVLRELVRWASGGLGRRDADRQVGCPYCGRRTLRHRDHCDWCGRHIKGEAAAELADLTAFRRQLERFRARKLVDPAVAGELSVQASRCQGEILHREAGKPGGIPVPAAPASPFEKRQEAVDAEVIVAEAVREPSPAAAPAPAVPPARPRTAEPPPPPPGPLPAPARPPELLPPRVTPQPVAAAARPQPRPEPTVRPVPAPPPPPPGKSWLETLGEFLEERNIPLAEVIGLLVGTILIVGPSVALVISFREALEKIPYLQFGLFVSGASLVFGVGLYVYHRWKLEATGFTVLLIATLLVPLNFLAMVSMSGQELSLWKGLVELAALGIFTFLMGWTARTLVPGGPWFQVFGVVGNAAAVLVVARLSGIVSHGWPMAAVGLVPVAVFAAAVAPYLWQLHRKGDLDSRGVIGLFTLLGTTAFSLGVALGLLVAVGARTDGLNVTLQHVAPLFALAAVPVLSAGLAVMRHTSADASLAAYRTVGTAIALLGVVVMLAALVMAWPLPPGVIAVGTSIAAALVYLAFRHQVPIAHAGAIAAATLVYLLGFHLLQGNVPWDPAGDAGRQILEWAISASSGTALLGLFVVLVAAGEGLARCGFRTHGQVYAGGSLVVALLSLLLVTWGTWFGGSATALDATLVYGIYGLGSLAMAARWLRREATYLGLGLLVAASLWALWWRTDELTPLWAAVVAVEGLVLGLISAALVRLGGHRLATRWDQIGQAEHAEPDNASPWHAVLEVYRLPLLHAAEAAAALAAGLALGTGLLEAGSAAHPVAAASVVALLLVTAWGYQSRERTWIASAVFCVGLGHALAFNWPELVQWPYTTALLGHATISTLAAAVAVALGRLLVRSEPGAPAPSLADKQPVPPPVEKQPVPPPVEKQPVPPQPVAPPVVWIASVFAEPLARSGLISSTAALVLLLNVSGREPLWLAGCLFWLAALWLVIGWMERSALVWAVAQAVLSGSAVAATVAWLQRFPWDGTARVDLLEPRSLQAYGIGLGLLGLAWIVVRLLARRSAEARRLLEPGWPAVDWLVGHGVVAAQFLLAVWYVARASLAELDVRIAINVAQYATVCGPTAWILVGVLALMLLTALWHRWGRAELAAALVLAATAAVLLAGPWAAQAAAASALRWHLAALCVLGSGLVWCRRALYRGCLRIAARPDAGPRGPAVAQAVLLATTALPVVGLTILAALHRLPAVTGGGPAAGSFFAGLDPNVSYLVPLLLVIGSLVGFALREASSGYAFSAGLVLQLTVILAYLLHLVTGNRSVGPDEIATVFALSAITAAAWAAAWLAARLRVNVWRETPAGGPARVLMNLQLAIGQLAAGLVLVPALALVALVPTVQHGWTVAAGSVWGWVAVLSVTAATVYRQVQLRRSIRPGVAGVAGMAALGLLACTVCLLWPDAPEWGYRTLMLGWAAYALLVALATWWVASVQTLPGAQGPPQVLIRAASGWVIVSGLAAVLLGLKAAFLHHDYQDLLWGAAAIAVASMAGAAMAVWRRREGWAFAAAPGVNLAASLVVWYFQWHGQPGITFDQWWVLLVQANIIASAGVALVWLAARNRLYELRDLSIRTSPMLGLQTALGIAATAALLVPAVFGAVDEPDRLAAWTAQLAAPAGWIALAMAAAAAGWYLVQVSPRDLLHVVAGLALGIGVLAMCLTERFGLDPAPPWLSYHVLMTAWAAAALGVLAAGRFGRRLRLAGLGDPGQPGAPAASEPIFPAAYAAGWVTLIGALVVGLSLVYVDRDPTGPWWSVGAIFSVSLMAGLIALWLRLPVYVDFSGVLLNVAGTAWWLAQKPATWETLLEVNAVCLAIGSAAWSLVQMAHPAGEPVFRIGWRRETFARLAAQLGLALLAGMALVFVGFDAAGQAHAPTDRLTWIALGATAAAVLVCLWDRSARFVLPGLYLLGLTALAFGLDARGLTGPGLAWTAAPELAAFALLAAVSGWLVVRSRPLWQALRIPADEDRWPAGWLPGFQAAVAGLAAVLAVWVAIDPAFDPMQHPLLAWPAGRIAGPGALLVLLGAAIVTAGLSGGLWRAGWQCATLALGTLTLSGLGWAWLAPDQSLPWLHRNVILMVAAVATTLIAGFGLPQVPRLASDWIAAGRRAVPLLAGLALAVLAIVLGQELTTYVPFEGVPMALWAKIVVTAALSGLVIGCLVFALVPKLDPLQLSDRGRTLYVYAGEAIILLICLHLRLTLPDLFRHEIMRKYWMLIVLGVAFLGAGLSELFRRRGMPVLSEPLERTAELLPLAPAIGFGFAGRISEGGPLAGDSPAVWFLGAIFYGILAATRQKARFAVASLVAMNVGLWVLWYRLELDFANRPQLFLIPVALCLLVAEYLNHNRLSTAQSTGLRYVSLGMIYISSAAEYLPTVGQSVWLPLVLIVLSLVGILAGILLRIRSFLYMGVTFLTLVIVTMIRYAYVDREWTWILWVCCIILGTGVLAAVGFYEKRRDRMLAAVRRFRQWEM